VNSSGDARRTRRSGSREFNAPKHLRIRYTTPELIKRWWNAKRVVTVAEVDLRVGGKWRYVW
jgi:hypothetical protein